MAKEKIKANFQTNPRYVENLLQPGSVIISLSVAKIA